MVNHYGGGPATTSALAASSGGTDFTAIDPPSTVVNCEGIACRGVFTNYIWPVVAADQDGTGKLLIHIAAEDGNTSAGYNAITYFRGVSSGTNMEAGMYGTCGTFIDSSQTTGYDIAADPYSNRVVIAYPIGRQATANRENNDLGYRLSPDMGASWGSRVNVTNYPTAAKERCGEEVSVLFTADNCFHILFIGNIYDSVATTVSNQEAKLYHWSSCTPTCKKMVLDANNHDDASLTPAFEYNVCKINLTQCVSSVLNDTLLYATYTRYLGTTASPDRSVNSYPNGEVFISPSSTWGETWGEPVNLTNTNTNGCQGTPASYCADDRYTSSARYVNDSLRIEFLEDLDAGNFVNGQGADLDNPVKFLSYPCIAMAPYQILTCAPVSPLHAGVNATATQDLSLTNDGNQSINWTSSLVGGDVNITLPASGTVPAGCINSATITITVGPKSTEGTFHNTIRFTYQGGAKTLDVPVEFSTSFAVNYSAGNAPYSVFAADLDGDGDRDLAVANYYGGNISVLKNNGNGTFAAAVNYAAGANPYSVFAADLDGDGDADLAVANTNSSNVSVLKNNGNGTFAAAVNYGAGNSPYSVFAADLDGDGDADLVVGNYYSISVLKNNGDGTCAAAVNYAAGSYPTSVFAADLDGDGDRDLVVADYYGNNVSVLKNNGNGTFAAAVKYGAGNSPYSVFAADLDGDGDADLAVANFNGNNVSVLKNNGDGTFAAAVNYEAGSSPRSVFAADLDGDGDRDLAVANFYGNNVSVLKNNGDGTFAAAVNYAAGSLPTSVFAADLDGHGNADLAVANYYSDNVSVLLNIFGSNYVCGDANSDVIVDISDVVYLIAYIFSGGLAPSPLVAGDANCDSIVDISDVVYLIAYIFSGGLAPCKVCK